MDFLCVYKSSFYSRRDTAKCHCEFVEPGGKLKEYTIIGSSSLLIPIYFLTKSTYSNMILIIIIIIIIIILIIIIITIII